MRDGAAETGTFDELRHLTRTSVVVDTARPLEPVTRGRGSTTPGSSTATRSSAVDAGELNHVLEQLVELDVRSMVASPPTLEELFLRHYDDGRRLRARGGTGAVRSPMNGFTGTSRLVRLALRRDRLTLPAWVLGMAGFLAATTAMFADSYADHPSSSCPTRAPSSRTPACGSSVS